MAQNAAQAGDITLHPVEFDMESAKFDLTLSLSEASVQGEKKGLSGSLQYNKDLFEAHTIENLVQHFVSLCDRIVATPDVSLSAINMLSESEMDLQLNQWNQTGVAYDSTKTIHQWFMNQARETPDSVAVVFGDQQQTYRELDCASNIVAQYLIDQGVTQNDRVGLCLDRCLHVMTSIIAVLKAGATYVPLDANYPEGRIRHIVEDAEMCWVLTRESIQENLPKGEWTFIDVDDVLFKSEQSGESGENTVNVDPSAERLLYLIYTSGSTGRPKGTGAYHRAEVNLLHWYTREFSVTEDDNFMLMSALGFDLTQKNLFAPLVSGATLVIPTNQEYDPKMLAAQIEENEVTWINCAPSAFYGLQDDTDFWPKIAT